MSLGTHLDEVLGLELSPSVLTRLERLDELLVRWGNAVDLVGFKTARERHHRYFAEALSALSWLPAEGRALDIGSGGGSPALPLAIVRPELEWTLVEANERKAMFLEEALRTVALERAQVVCARYETFVPAEPLDVVTLRGVVATHALLAKVATELAPAGRLLRFSGEDRLRTPPPPGWALRAPAFELVPGGSYLGVLVHVSRAG